MTGHLEKSAEVLSVMNQLMSIPATAASLRDMQKEMYKAGMIEEMMNDGLADAMGDDEVRASGSVDALEQPRRESAAGCVSDERRGRARRWRRRRKRR